MLLAPNLCFTASKPTTRAWTAMSARGPSRQLTFSPSLLLPAQTGLVIRATHRQLTDDQRKAAGARPDVVRLSIGIEDKADIAAGLEQRSAQVV
jgi:hypothetical protein